MTITAKKLLDAIKPDGCLFVFGIPQSWRVLATVNNSWSKNYSVRVVRQPLVIFKKFDRTPRVLYIFRKRPPEMRLP